MIALLDPAATPERFSPHAHVNASRNGLLALAQPYMNYLPVVQDFRRTPNWSNQHRRQQPLSLTEHNYTKNQKPLHFRRSLNF